MADPNPNPSSDKPADGGAPKQVAVASPDNPANSGEPTDGVTLNQLAEAKARTLMQGNMDKNIALMGTGRYADMDPKVLELLDSYEKIVQTNRPAEATPAKDENPYADILFSGEKKPAGPNVPSPLEEKGKEALRQETVAKLEEQIADRWVKAAWRKDAEAFFRDIGDVEGFDKDDFASVDLTDSKQFPINGDGYRQWLNNASLLRAKYLNDGGTTAKRESGDGGSSDPNAVDRALAKRTKRQPAANSSAEAANTLLDAAKQRHEGKMSDSDFREQIKKRIPRGGRVIA